MTTTELHRLFAKRTDQESQHELLRQEAALDAMHECEESEEEEDE